MKRLVCALLMTALVMGLCPGVLAAEDTIRIHTVEDLLAMVSNPSGNYILMEDLDMTGVVWTPVDLVGGSFDGNGHAILNLTVNTPGSTTDISYDGNRKEYDTCFAGFFGVLRDSQVKNLRLINIRAEVEADVPCFLGSIAGASSLDYFTHGQDIILGEVNEMPNQFLYELIIAISNRGHVDSVMNAARSAGAMGGTVLHAKGTNPFGENKFFGMSIADEKEMIMILTAANQKTAIMRAIMDQAGVHSPAHTVMFTLPVESVGGLRSVMIAAGEIEE